MWPVGILLAAVAMATATQCPEARSKCAFRKGCGNALNNYQLLCSDVMSQPTDVCPEPCQHALIALTSTEEGKELMNCRCLDEFCIEMKKRMEVCRPQVLSAAANITSSCRLSQLICLADAQCATALDYSHRLCRSMYQGRKCSYKCFNSLEILKKQEKAGALTTCRCDGNENYDCPRMQSNLQRLCFHKHKKNHVKGEHKKPPKDEVRTDAALALVPQTLVSVCTVLWLVLNT